MVERIKNLFQKSQYASVIEEAGKAFNKSSLSKEIKLHLLDFVSNAHVELSEHKKCVQVCKDAVDILDSSSVEEKQKFQIIFLTRRAFALEAIEKPFESLKDLQAANSISSTTALRASIVRVSKMLVVQNFVILEEHKSSLLHYQELKNNSAVIDLSSRSLSLTAQIKTVEASRKLKEFELFFSLQRAKSLVQEAMATQNKESFFLNLFSLDISLCQSLLQEGITFDGLALKELSEQVDSLYQSFPRPFAQQKPKETLALKPKSLRDVEKGLSGQKEKAIEFLQHSIDPSILLKLSTGGFSSEFVELLLQILDVSKFEFDSFFSFFSCSDELVVSYLDALAKSDRFSLTVQFLNSNTKSCMHCAFNPFKCSAEINFFTIV